jgi:hypothetical protein
VIRLLQAGLDAATEQADDRAETASRLGWLLLHAMGSRKRLVLSRERADMIGPHAIHIGKQDDSLTVSVWPVDEAAPECRHCGERHQV